jgi:hypothetical protein
MFADNPLVTEWSASEKANLEARLRSGGVVVEYTGRSMRLLPQCRVSGSYVWRRTTTFTDLSEIRDFDELAAKLPLGAASLTGELARSGRLAVQTTVAGQYQLADLKAEDVPDNATCSAATHVVSALSIGTFKLRAGGTVWGKGSTTVGGVGISGATRSEETVLREAGDSDRCKLATEELPDGQCASPIQVFLVPLPRFERTRGGAGKVRVNFLSADPERTWGIVTGEGELCKTPCVRWVDPKAPVRMRHPVGFGVNETVDISNLREQGGGGPVQVSAHTMSVGKLVGGMTAAGMGGMSLMLGAMLAGVGCGSERRQEMCTPGIVMMGVSAPLIAGGVWLILGSGAHADVEGSGMGFVPRSELARAGALPPSRRFGLGGAF